MYCLQDNHCRSVNVRGENHQSGEGCELLPGVHSENPFNLVKDKYFDHFAIMPLNRSMVSDPKYLIVNKNPNFLVIGFWMVPELLCTFAPTFDLYYWQCLKAWNCQAVRNLFNILKNLKLTYSIHVCSTEKKIDAFLLFCLTVTRSLQILLLEFNFTEDHQLLIRIKI